jgi:hypothetical protein
MIKHVFFVVLLLIHVVKCFGQTRYLDEIFTDVDLTTNVQYASNYNFLLGTPTPNFPLYTDVYEPTGDNETGRAAVILLHDGNFLPKYLNQTPIGNNKDSALVVSAEMFAKRGYVAFAPNYRLGWNHTNVDPVNGLDIRRGTYINAVYRALNDTKSLVRYIKKTVAENGNPYGVNPDKIIIYGHGSGGYVALAYASLDRFEEIETAPNGKWLSNTTVPSTSYVQGEPYVDTTEVGNIEGFGGIYNDTNHFGYSNDVLGCVNAGGALLDSNWIEVGEVPIISFQCPDDGFAPFDEGLVIVPTTQEVVVDVVGSKWVSRKVNELSNNSVLYTQTPYNDSYTIAAETALQSSHPELGVSANDYRGLFPFIRPTIQWPFQESTPWDWWDESTMVAEASPLVGASAAQTIHDNGIGGNPDMSAAKGKAYLDTIHGYLAPRLFTLINACLPTTSNSVVTECGSYSWNGQTYNQSGTYTYQTTGSQGCDSIATLDLTIDPNIEESESYTLCDGEAVTVNGTTYTQTGQYTQIIPGGNACDTLLTIDVQSETAPALSILGNTNIAPNSGENYAFTDPTGYTILWSAVNGTVISGQGTPVVTVFWDGTGGGVVNLTLSNNNCSYTYTLPVGNLVGIDNHWMNDLQIHPNPSTGIFNIELTEPTLIIVMDARGRKIVETNGNGQFNLDLNGFSKGTYIVQVQTSKGLYSEKLILQ